VSGWTGKTNKESVIKLGKLADAEVKRWRLLLDDKKILTAF
jgi:hypothetical protein